MCERQLITQEFLSPQSVFIPNEIKSCLSHSSVLQTQDFGCFNSSYPLFCKCIGPYFVAPLKRNLYVLELQFSIESCQQVRCFNYRDECYGTQSLRSLHTAPDVINQANVLAFEKHRYTTSNHAEEEVFTGALHHVELSDPPSFTLCDSNHLVIRKTNSNHNHNSVYRCEYFFFERRIN